MNYCEHRLTNTIVVITLMLLFHQAAVANWCNGSRYLLFEMPLSERLNQASKAVRQTSAALAEQATRLKLDFETHNTVIQQQMNSQRQQLGIQTVALCEAGKDDEFPLQAQHFVLQSKMELNERLRLNLGLLAAQQKAQQTMYEQRQQLQQLAVILQARHNTLAVLLAEMHGNTTALQAPAAQHFVQSACLAVTESDDVLDQIELLNRHQLLAENIEAQQGTPISDQQLAQFMDHCEIDPSANNGLFGRLFNSLTDWL